MEIRIFNEKDEIGIRSLFAICFGREMSHEEWAWKYKGSPWGSTSVVAIDESDIVAHYGGLRMKFNFKGKTLDAFQFCDVMTHPKYRGRFVSKTPIIVSLGGMFYEKNQMDFAFGFPSLRHAKLQSIRLGGEGYRHVRLYKKENLKIQFITWGFREKEGWQFLKSKDLVTFTLQHSEKLLQLVKDEHYLKWRYREHPSKRYRLLVVRKFNITKGYIIFTVEDNWFNIVELFYKKTKELKNILISAERFALNNIYNIKGIKAWFHPHEPIIKYLETIGYSNEDDVPIAFKQVNRVCGVTSGIFYENYCYRMGDYDAN